MEISLFCNHLVTSNYSYLFVENAVDVFDKGVFTLPHHQKQDMTQGQVLSEVKTGLNSKFSFFWTGCLTEAKELSLSFYVPIAGGRTDWFMSLPREISKIGDRSRGRP